MINLVRTKRRGDAVNQSGIAEETKCDCVNRLETNMNDIYELKLNRHGLSTIAGAHRK